MKKFLWAILVFTLSCDDELECGNQEETDEVYLQFFEYRTQSLIDASFNNIQIFYGDTLTFFVDSLQVGVGNSLILPVNPLDNQTTYVFATDSGNHTAVMNYSSNVFLDNKNCPATFRIGNLSFSLSFDGEAPEGETIDSVSVLVRDLSKLVAPHVEIYL